MKLDVQNTHNAKYLAMLPHWKCHKVVQAGKISFMARDEPNGQLMIHAEPSNMPFAVPLDFLYRHNPTIGGYFVVYEDGYISYSPAEAFESGYHRPETGTANGGTGSAAPGVNLHNLDVLTTDMPPHQLRVMEELADLALKLQKLTAFFDTDTYRALDVDERGRLKEQSLFMQEYQRVLIERVAAFQ